MKILFSILLSFSIVYLLAQSSAIVSDCDLYKVGVINIKNTTNGRIKGSVYYQHYVGGLGHGPVGLTAADFELAAGDSTKIPEAYEGKLEWSARIQVSDPYNVGQIIWESLPSIHNANNIVRCKNNFYNIR